ncbi:hypothetical protein BDV11DRAFT_155044 [Aspergillus similis]
MGEACFGYVLEYDSTRNGILTGASMGELAYVIPIRIFVFVKPSRSDKVRLLTTRQLRSEENP